VVSVAVVPRESGVVAAIIGFVDDDPVSIIIICNIILKIKINNNNHHHYCKNYKDKKAKK